MNGGVIILGTGVAVAPEKGLGKYSWGQGPFLLDDENFQLSAGGYPY